MHTRDVEVEYCALLHDIVLYCIVLYRAVVENDPWKVMENFYGKSVGTVCLSLWSAYL